MSPERPSYRKSSQDNQLVDNLIMEEAGMRGETHIKCLNGKVDNELNIIITDHNNINK